MTYVQVTYTRRTSARVDMKSLLRLLRGHVILKLYVCIMSILFCGIGSLPLEPKLYYIYYILYIPIYSIYIIYIPTYGAYSVSIYEC